jgi:hypothetical protein
MEIFLLTSASVLSSDQSRQLECVLGRWLDSILIAYIIYEQGIFLFSGKTSWSTLTMFFRAGTRLWSIHAPGFMLPAITKTALLGCKLFFQHWSELIVGRLALIGILYLKLETCII